MELRLIISLIVSRPRKVRLENLTFGGLIMSKYNFDTKLQIVADYIAGEGVYIISEKILNRCF